MSSDNLLLLRKTKTSTYEGYDIFSEAEIVEDYDPVFTAETLEEAVRLANEYCKNNLVEYGIHFDI